MRSVFVRGVPVGVRADGQGQSVVLHQVLVGHEGDEGFVVGDGVLDYEFEHLARGGFGFDSGFGVVDMEADGLEFFGGGVTEDDLFFCCEEASVEVAIDEGSSRRASTPKSGSSAAKQPSRPRRRRGSTPAEVVATSPEAAWRRRDRLASNSGPVSAPCPRAEFAGSGIAFAMPQRLTLP